MAGAASLCWSDVTCLQQYGATSILHLAMAPLHKVTLAHNKMSARGLSYVACWGFNVKNGPSAELNTPQSQAWILHYFPFIIIHVMTEWKYTTLGRSYSHHILKHCEVYCCLCTGSLSLPYSDPSQASCLWIKGENYTEMSLKTRSGTVAQKTSFCNPLLGIVHCSLFHDFFLISLVLVLHHHTK